MPSPSGVDPMAADLRQRQRQGWAVGIKGLARQGLAAPAQVDGMAPFGGPVDTPALLVQDLKNATVPIDTVSAKQPIAGGWNLLPGGHRRSRWI